MRIKNWESFQHYKHRSPPWIRLYRKLLDDPEWFALSGDASKMLANCWLLAAERDGTLPSVPMIAFRLRLTEARVKELISQLSHWVELDASTMLADRKQVATTETETETETDAACAHSEVHSGAVVKTGEPLEIEKPVFGPPATPEAQYFERGKEVLGQSSGGMLAKLLKAKAGNIALARSAIELASTKQDPREYIGAIIRGADPPENSRVYRW